MPHYVYDNTALEYPKTDLNVLPVGANPDQYIVADDWNTTNQALDDVKSFLRGAKWYGMEAQASDPLPAGITDYLWLGTNGVLNIKRGATPYQVVTSARQVIAGAGLDGGGSLSSDVTLQLEPVPGVSGSYVLPSITVDQYGRITSVTSGSSSGYVTMVNDTTPVTSRSSLRVDGTLLQVADDGVNAWTVLSAPGLVPKTTQVIAGTALSGGGALSSDVTLNHANSPVVTGTYAGATVTVDQQGHITSISAVTYVLPSRAINTTARLTGGGDLSADRTIDLATSGVVAGTYTNTTLTVDAYGRITSASSGQGLAIGSTVGSGTTGSVLFVDASGNLGQDNTNFFWDDANNVLRLNSLQLQSGSAVAVGAAGTARFRYNETTQKVQVSLNGAAYVDIQTGAEATIDIGDAVGGGTSGAILFVNSSGQLAQDPTVLFWDDTNNRLAIGTNVANYTLHVAGTVGVGGGITPLSNGTYNLGTSGARWADIWGRYLYAAEHLEIRGSSTTGVSNLDTARLRWNEATDKLEVSLNQTAYVEFVYATRQVLAGSGLTGGGALSADVTLNVGAGTGITVNADDVAVNQATAFSWTASHTWNLGTTPATAIQVLIDQPAVSGTRNSHSILLRGTAHDGVSGHSADWQQHVEVTSTAGGSRYQLQSRVDAASYVTRLQIDDTGLLTTKFLYLEGSSQDAYLRMADGQSAGVSGANEGRLIYNTSTQKFQVSMNGAAYVDIQTGAEYALDIGDSIGSSTAGSVLFVGAGGVLAQDNTNFFWDDANNRLGVGTTTPSNTLHVKGSGRIETTVDTSTELLRFASPSYYAWIGLNSGLFNIISQNGAVNFGSVGTSRWQVNTSGHFVPAVDNTYDLGTSGSRARTGYFGTSVQSPLYTAAAGAGTLVVEAPSGGILDLKGGASSGIVRLWSNGSERWSIDADGNLEPVNGGVYDIAGSVVRVRDVYATHLDLKATSGTEITLNRDAVAGTHDMLVFQRQGTTKQKAYLGAFDRFRFSEAVYGDKRFHDSDTTDSGSVTTTDATTTNVNLYTPPDQQTTSLLIHVSTHMSDYSKGGGWLIAITVRRNGATVTQVGSVTTLYEHKDDAGLSVSANISGTSVRVQVTGLAASTFTWRCQGRVVRSSDLAE